MRPYAIVDSTSETKRARSAHTQKENVGWHQDIELYGRRTYRYTRVTIAVIGNYWISRIKTGRQIRDTRNDDHTTHHNDGACHEGRPRGRLRRRAERSTSSRRIRILLVIVLQWHRFGVHDGVRLRWGMLACVSNCCCDCDISFSDSLTIPTCEKSHGGTYWAR